MLLVGIIRVSSKSQEDNTSLDEQKRQIEAYCQYKGYELVKIFEEVGTAKNSSRDSITEVFNYVIENNLDGIIATKTDRVFRNMSGLTNLVENLKSHSKRLILTEMNLDTSDYVGEMFVNILSSIASFERNRINERVNTGRKAKKEQGGYIGGQLAYGEKSVNKKKEVDETDLKTIVTIKRHYQRGKSYNAIAEFLNKNIDKYPTKHSNSKWYAQTVKNIILNS